MDERLFDIESIPEVPLLREPRRVHAARGVALDARFANDYPPSWNRCEACSGDGWANLAADRRVVTFKNADGTARGDCERCLAMGSLKARARLEAGHRCVRCLHPYMPKGDAKMLGVEPSPFQWSPCDVKCTHLGPIRWREENDFGANPWNEQNLDTVGQPAGEGIYDFGPSGERVHRYDVEAEWRILTVHHLDGDKANCRWWNLAALCQICHLTIQAKVVMERIYPHEHSEWFKPYVAGYYAHVYLGEDLTREQVDTRTDELLALELATERN